jgi:hypothetical protein
MSIVWVLQVGIQTLSVLKALDHIDHQRLEMMVPLETHLTVIPQTEIHFIDIIATGMYLNI